MAARMRAQSNPRAQVQSMAARAEATVRTAAYWSVVHGLPRLVFKGPSQTGDLVSRLTFDESLRDDPFGIYEEVRACGPLIRSSRVSVTVDHGVTREVLTGADFSTAARFTSLPPFLKRILDFGTEPSALGPVDPPSLLSLDPPDHGRLRRLVSREFTARSVTALTPRIEAKADELLDSLLSRGGEFDAVEEYAARLPVWVIAELLGVPESDHEDLLAWGNASAITLDTGVSWAQYRPARTALREIHHWFEGHLDRLRANPGTDLLSRLATAAGDDALTDLELRATGLLLLGAGFETTVNLIGNGIALLAEHPDQLKLLRADPELWPNAVEEMLRFDSPVQMTGRLPIREVTLGGIVVPKHRPVLLYLGGANRDPAVFTDPHAFDITRSNAREHLALSAGAHYCLGAGLARLETAVALRRLYERLPDLHVRRLGPRRQTRVLRGFSSLWIDTGLD